MPSEYHLFRAKFIRPKQTSFLHGNDSPTTLFVDSLAERPYAAFRRDYTWHIGNLTKFEPNTGYFAVGRSSQTSIPKLDPATGDFVDTEDDTSPYTYVVYDAAIGLMAIQRKNDLTSSTKEIATKLERLLGHTRIIIQNEVDVKIDPIPDPEGFVSRLEAAHAIKKFTASFTGPNPIDADELFQKPLSVYLKAANGDHGTAIIEGSHLDSEVLVAVARSTAATGNSASARIQEVPGKRPIRINLSGDPVKLNYEDDQHLFLQVLADAQAAYKKVKHEGD